MGGTSHVWRQLYFSRRDRTQSTVLKRLAGSGLLRRGDGGGGLRGGRGRLRLGRGRRGREDGGGGARLGGLRRGRGRVRRGRRLRGGTGCPIRADKELIRPRLIARVERRLPDDC